MSTFHAISKSEHAGKRFKRYTSYAFAAGETIAPLVQQELVKASVCMPVAFTHQGGSFTLVAVQGFLPGKNLFVTPDGRWAGDYIPAGYRGYPFALLPDEAGRQLLCLDMDSGLLSDMEGEVFFDAGGDPSQSVKDVMGFLEQIAQNHRITQNICLLLARHQLIQPWPLKVQTDEGAKDIAGLHRIDEAALNQLDGGALKELQQSGALQVAYMQLLSTQHTDKLVQLAKAHAEHNNAAALSALPVSDKGELDLEFLNQGGTLSFAGL